MEKELSKRGLGDMLEDEAGAKMAFVFRSGVEHAHRQRAGRQHLKVHHVKSKGDMYWAVHITKSLQDALRQAAKALHLSVQFRCIGEGRAKSLSDQEFKVQHCMELDCLA